MNRSVFSIFAAATLLAVGACSPDNDQAEVQQVDEVYTPAPVMPPDSMMRDTTLQDTLFLPDTLVADTAVGGA